MEREWLEEAKKEKEKGAASSPSVGCQLDATALHLGLSSPVKGCPWNIKASFAHFEIFFFLNMLIGV